MYHLIGGNPKNRKISHHFFILLDYHRLRYKINKFFCGGWKYIFFYILYKMYFVEREMKVKESDIFYIFSLLSAT